MSKVKIAPASGHIPRWMVWVVCLAVVALVGAVVMCDLAPSKATSQSAVMSVSVVETQQGKAVAAHGKVSSVRSESHTPVTVTVVQPPMTEVERRLWEVGMTSASTHAITVR